MQMPVTVAGPRRHFTGFRVPRLQINCEGKVRFGSTCGKSARREQPARAVHRTPHPLNRVERACAQRLRRWHQIQPARRPLAVVCGAPLHVGKFGTDTARARRICHSDVTMPTGVSRCSPARRSASDGCSRVTRERGSSTINESGTPAATNTSRVSTANRSGGRLRAALCPLSTMRARDDSRHHALASRARRH